MTNLVLLAFMLLAYPVTSLEIGDMHAILGVNGAILPNDVLGAAWKVSESEVATTVVEPRLLSSHDELFQWDQKGNDIDGEAADDQSGDSVSLSSDGNVVAIGALGNDENGPLSGHVRVYAFESSSWVQRGADIDGEDAVDFSGRSVSLSNDGNVVAIGAFLNDGNGTNSGHVRVYAFESSSWVQRGADIDGEAARDTSGESVSLSNDGNVVAIGANSNDENGTNSGHVRVYAFESSSWVQRGADIDGEAAGDTSGNRVSLSSDGNVVAIGAIRNDGNGTDSGHVRVYAFEFSSWVQRGADIDGEADADQSGSSVSLSSDGAVVAIGAQYNDGVNGTYSGHVRVYAFESSSWVQRGADIDGEAANDRSGTSVSLSGDGNVVAIGAPRNDGNGTSSGQVRVYAFESSSWVQRGADIDGEAAVDNSGKSVSLSSDGNVIAIGAWGNGYYSGHVRVYSFPKSPSDEPSVLPSDEPSVLPSDEPSVLPSDEPSVPPSDEPSILPSVEPSVLPSDKPSVLPSNEPSVLPSASSLPSILPSISIAPSCVPSMSPSPTKTPKSTKDRGLKAKSEGCSGKSFPSEKSSKSKKSTKSKKSRRNVLSFANNDKGVKAKEGGSSGGGTLVEFVVLEEGMNQE
eukprot:scaffold2308_cov141-Chaetoceros_neogracile.AAC.1